MYRPYSGSKQAQTTGCGNELRWFAFGFLARIFGEHRCHGEQDDIRSSPVILSSRATTKLCHHRYGGTRWVLWRATAARRVRTALPVAQRLRTRTPARADLRVQGRQLHAAEGERLR